MPATITTGTKAKTTKATTAAKPAAKTTPAKGSKATQAKTAPKPKAEPKPKFVAPAKPTTDPTGIKIEAYTYADAKGERRFWQGYDAKFKKNLMASSRALPQTKESAAARAILIERGWSTAEREAAFVQVAQDRADRAKAKAAAKTEKAKAPAKPKAQADPEPEPVVAEVTESTEAPEAA